MSTSAQNSDATFEPLSEVRAIIAVGRTGALATLNADGSPLTTLVTYAPLMNGQVVFLLSRLSAHTQNLLRDPRSSILIDRKGKGDPLAHPRVSINGLVHEVSDADLKLICRQRFLMRHPKAKLYVDFGDFSFWQLQAQHVHFNGGFAKAAQLRGDELSYNGASIMSLAAAEAEIIESLNQRYNGQFHLVFGDEKAKNSSKNYKIISFDLDGVDFMSGEDIQRQSFANKITKAEQLEDELKLIFEKAIGSN